MAFRLAFSSAISRIVQYAKQETVFSRKLQLTRAKSLNTTCKQVRYFFIKTVSVYEVLNTTDVTTHSEIGIVYREFAQAARRHIFIKTS